MFKMKTPVGIGLAAMAACLCAFPAVSQDALGDGSALDANTGVGTGGRNVRSRQPNFELRNLIVTGDVAGGRGFRGTVGYSATRDFRGELGSNDLFSQYAFSAPSLLSWRQAGRAPSDPVGFGVEYGLEEYRRDFLGSTPETVQMNAYRTDEPYRDLMTRRIQMDRALRDRFAPTDPMIGEANPDTLAVYSTAEGETQRFVASPLRGVQIESASTDFGVIGLTPYDEARLLRDRLAGDMPAIGQPFQRGLDEFRVADGEVAGSMQTSPFGRSITDEYDDLMRTMMASTLGTDPDAQTGQALDQQLTGMSNWLSGPAAGVPEEQAGGWRVQTSDAGEEEPGNQLWQGSGRPLVPAVPTRDDSDPPVSSARGSEPSLPADLDLTLLRHGREITTLVPEGEDRFAELVTVGESKLRSGAYFDAEADFVRALRVQPNHPLAEAGLCHAQLGAQVYASAALRLRSLFIAHPEMIDVTFGDGLLPSEDRLRADVRTLRERLEAGRRSADSALLIAYIGRQLQDRAMIQDGIDRMMALDARDPLIAALRVVWLGESVETVEQDLRLQRDRHRDGAQK